MGRCGLVRRVRARRRGDGRNIEFTGSSRRELEGF